MNSYTLSSQEKPSIASLPNGEALVVWEDVGNDGSGFGVFARRLSSSGAPIGPQFQINGYTTRHQHTPKVASDAAGHFMVVWVNSWDTGATPSDIWGRRYDASGVPQGPEFRINSSSGRHEYPAVAFDASGTFTVVWTAVRPSGAPGTRVFAQRFSQVGAPVGAEFQVSDSTAVGRASVAAANMTGGFVVVWSQWLVPSDPDVFGRRYDNDGGRIGGEFRVNSYTTGEQDYGVLSSDSKGNFVVAWNSYGQDGSDSGVFGQRYLSSGSPDGAEFQVNSYTTDRQRWPSIATDASGRFVITWSSLGQDGDAYGIYGRQFAPDIIFGDGFD